ncbi:MULTISPECIES: ABC transporter substrate-binding protein [unclassified Paenibacillus]|uniref:ABC transporter substrate-binding protein n=1 Tax=unclassified Paenibacillus TaxID=185978 RepID=UPI00363B5238
MNKIRKGIPLAALAALLAFSGCSGSGSEKASSSSDAAGTKKAPVKLTIWGGVPEESGPKDVVANWNKANPELQVEYIRYVNDDSGNTKLDTALISKTDAPDIFISYGETYYNRRMNAGMAAPLDDLIAKNGFKVDEIIGSSNIIKSNNTTFYLPAMKQLSMVMINQTALTSTGEKLPDQWTWDDYVKLAGKLTKGEAKGSFIQAPGEILPKITLTLAKPKDSYYNDKGSSNFDSPSLQKGLELQKQLYDKGNMVSWAETVSGKLATHSELFTGKANMILGGTHLIRYVKDTKNFPRDFKVAFASNPQLESGGKVNIAGFNDLMSINSKSTHKEEAMKFIAWYLSEGNTAMIAGGRIPTNKKADMDKVVELFVGDAAALMDVESLKKILKTEYVFPAQVQSTAYAELTKILTEESEKYFMNVQPIDKTMQTIKTRADQAIQAAKK